MGLSSLNSPDDKGNIGLDCVHILGYLQHISVRAEDNTFNGIQGRAEFCILSFEIDHLPVHLD